MYRMLQINASMIHTELFIRTTFGQDDFMGNDLNSIDRRIDLIMMAGRSVSHDSI